jgi:hypothetical protein
MATTMGARPYEFLLSTANGSRAFEAVTIVSGAGALAAGTVLGKITASGKYTAYSDAAADGSQAAAAILCDAVDATSADQLATVIARDAEVFASKLTGSDANGLTDLAALNIIARS